MNREFALGAVILAAGASSRMGKPKMLLPWGETTILGHEIAVWKSLGATQVAVVIAQDDAAIRRELDRISFRRDDRIINPDPNRGMFSSIQCAARWSGWNDALTHFALVLGDQPHLQTTTLRSLVEFSAKDPNKVCQPIFNGHGRHPVVFPKPIFEQLASSNRPSLREVLQSVAEKINRVDLNDPGLDLDLDYRADYEKARRNYDSGAAPQ